ncbi:RIKEN cDNA 2410129H14, partial [Mus musculus]
LVDITNINLNFELFKHKNWLCVPLSCKLMEFELLFVKFSVSHLVFKNRIQNISNHLLNRIFCFLPSFWQLKV